MRGREGEMIPRVCERRGGEKGLKALYEAGLHGERQTRAACVASRI